MVHPPRLNCCSSDVNRIVLVDELYPCPSCRALARLSTTRDRENVPTLTAGSDVDVVELACPSAAAAPCPQVAFEAAILPQSSPLSNCLTP